MQKIIIHEKTVVVRLQDTTIRPYQKVIRKLTRYDTAATLHTIQKISIREKVRFRVTTCLYLRPNNRARSLSTLTAVTVNRETVPNI